jgi:transposase
VLLRHFLAEGLTKTEAAERLGISRRTVSRWIGSGDLDRDLDEPVRYRPRPPVPRKLDPYRGIIQARLEAYPELSSVRLMAEIRAAGYDGGYTQLKEYVREIRPRPPEEPLVRFETAPGRQAQVDFADFTFGWGKRYALMVVLGYSRLLWVRFFTRKDMRALLVGLEEAFGVFGGVPQELLFDQMRSVITKDGRLSGEKLVTNAEFIRFAAHWGFKVRACRPYRAKTKGKSSGRSRTCGRTSSTGASSSGTEISTPSAVTGSSTRPTFGSTGPPSSSRSCGSSGTSGRFCSRSRRDPISHSWCPRSPG